MSTAAACLEQGTEMCRIFLGRNCRVTRQSSWNEKGQKTADKRHAEHEQMQVNPPDYGVMDLYAKWRDCCNHSRFVRSNASWGVYRQYR